MNLAATGSDERWRFIARARQTAFRQGDWMSKPGEAWSVCSCDDWSARRSGIDSARCLVFSTPRPSSAKPRPGWLARQPNWQCTSWTAPVVRTGDGTSGRLPRHSV